MQGITDLITGRRLYLQGDLADKSTGNRGALDIFNDDDQAEAQQALDKFETRLKTDRPMLIRELISGEWIVYHDFIRYNPMATTFDWSDLCLQQEADQANGRTSWAQSPAKWKIYHHTRFRVLLRER